MPAGVGAVIPVKFTGVVGEGKSGIYNVAVDGLAGETKIRMQTGPAINGTDLRDATGEIKFGDFKNQIEYQNAGAAINNAMKQEVLAGIDTARAAGQDGHGHRRLHPRQSEELARHAGGDHRAMNDTPTASPDAREVVLAARNVAKSYGAIHALKGVNFDIHRGQVTTLFGENGAGKSTLMKVLSGVIRPTSGEIILDGKPVAFASSTEARDRGISIIHQELSLAPNLSVRDNIFMGREIAGATGVDFAEEERQTRVLMEELEEDIDPRTPVEELRLGQQQIVEIARALSVNSRILIMDEPTSALSRRRGRGAVQGDPRPAGPRRLDRLHLAPPRGGAADHQPRRGAARRRDDRLRAARGDRPRVDRAQHGRRELRPRLAADRLRQGQGRAAGSRT